MLFLNTILKVVHKYLNMLKIDYGQKYVDNRKAIKKSIFILFEKG